MCECPFKGADVQEKSEAAYDESGEKQSMHSEKESSQSGTHTLQEDETQLSFR